MTRPMQGAAAAAAVTVVLLIWYLGAPFDGFIAFLYAVVAGMSAFFAGGLVLAWMHVRRAPRIGRRACVALLPFTLLILGMHVHGRRAVPSMLAHADSVNGVVLGRNVLNNVGVLFVYRGAGGRLMAPHKLAHRTLSAGDSIRVYVDRRPPYDYLDVWPAGPDVLGTSLDLFWLWLIGIVVLAGYGPRVSTRLARPLLAVKSAGDGEGSG